MKLQNNLYTIVERNDNNFRIALNAEDTIYKAHFPEQPITPGVCIIQIASELLNVYFNRDISLSEVVNAKFLSVINPIETEEVVYAIGKMAYNETDNTLKVAITVSSDKTVCAKLSLLYKVND